MIKRVVLVGFAAVLAVAVIAAGGAYWFLRGDGVRLAIEQQASHWLGEPVTIGSATVQVVPRIGIALHDVRAGNPTGVTLADVRISMALRPLVSRRIEDAEIVVSDSRIEMPLPFTLPESTSSSSSAAQDQGGVEIVSVRTIGLRNVTLASRGRQITVSSDASLAGGRLNLTRFMASAGQTALEATGVVQLAPRLDAQLAVKANRVDVDDLVALADAFAPKTPRRSGSTTALPGRIVARVSAATARTSGVDVREFATTLVAQGNRITLSPVTFQLFGGRYQGSLDFDAEAAAMKATVRAQLTGLDVAQLAAFGGVADTMTGSLSGAGTFSGRGATVSDAIASAAGEGTATITNGQLKRLGLIRTIVLFFGRPAPNAGTSSDAFERIDAMFAIARQVVTASALSLHSADVDLVGQGILVIPTKALDGKVDLSLSEALSAQAGTDLSRFTREGNRVVLPAAIGGTLDAPHVNIDAKAAAGRGLRNEVQRRLKGLLDGLSPAPKD